MLIFHTSDLHIGKTVNGFNMLADQHHMLGQILEQMRLRRPDALIIAGDIYDKHIPGVEAVLLLDWFISELAGLGAAVFIVAGNHDSAERLCFAGDIIARNNIYISGGYDDSVARHVLQDEYGEVAFHLLPFFRPSVVNRYAEEDISGYDEAFAHVLSGLRRAGRNVLVAHQFMVYGGHTPQRCDSEMGSVGGVDAVDISPAADMDYVALGHLHGSQQVGREYIRYAGSPLKYSFSECRHNKSIVSLRLDGDGREIELIPIRPLHDMRKISGPIEILISPEVAAQGNAEDYIHATLTDEFAPDAMNRLRSVYPNIMALEFDNARSAARPHIADTAGELSALDMFDGFYMDVNGAHMDVIQRDIAARLLDETRSEV